MADPKNKKQDGAAKQPSLIVLIIAGLIVTLIAAGGGGGLGMMLSQMVQAPEPAKQKAEKPKAEQAPAGEKPAHGEAKDGEAAAEEEDSEEVHLVLKPMQPVLANLAAPAGAWIRIEASLLLDEEGAKDADVLAAKIGEDMLGFLRTVSLAQIEGASGYLHLREDLADLVQFKSEGHVRELILQSMVVE